jgi:hypothetical protein
MQISTKHAAIAAFSIMWVVLAYLSKYSTGAVSGISFYLPILIIFTVPVVLGRDETIVIGLLGGALGVNYLVSGGFQGALSTLVFTVGIMMLGMYYLAPKSMAEMKRPVDWFANIVLTVVLLTVGETLAYATGAFPDLTTAWSATSATVVGGIVLAIVNCLLLRFLTPAIRGAESAKSSESIPEHIVPAINNQTKS